MDFSDLTTDVLPEVPGCPSFTIERALRETAEDLCVRGHVYVYQMDEEPPDEDGYVYLEVPTRTRFVDVLSVTRSGSALRAWHRQDADAVNPQSGYVRPDDLQIRILGGDSTPVAIRLAVAPTRDAKEIADEVGVRWASAIVAGAKKRLMAIPGMTWSNPQLALYHGDNYERAVNSARLRASQDGVLARRQVRLRSI